MGFVRLLLAACVVLTHTPISYLPVMPGEMAVEFFFIISGFYMALVCATRYPVDTAPGRRAFYLARFLRLWPCFAVISALSLALYYTSWLWLGRPPTTAGLDELLADHLGVQTLLRLSNATMIGQDISSLFHVATDHTIRLTLGMPETLADGSMWMGYGRLIPQAWSIGTEIWFYLIVPFLAALSSRVLAAICIACLAFRLYLHASDLVAYFFFPAQLPLFILGMLAYRHGTLSLAVGLIGAALLTLTVFLLPHITSDYYSMKWIVYPAFAFGIKSLFESSKQSTADRYIGELSYPVYMSHLLVAGCLAITMKHLGITPHNEIVLAATLIASISLLVFVDMPMDRLRAALTRRVVIVKAPAA